MSSWRAIFKGGVFGYLPSLPRYRGHGGSLEFNRSYGLRRNYVHGTVTQPNCQLPIGEVIAWDKDVANSNSTVHLPSGGKEVDDLVDDRRRCKDYIIPGQTIHTSAPSSYQWYLVNH